jgi:hypothetical protein
MLDLRSIWAVSQLAVVVKLEKRVVLFSMVIGACVGFTCDSGWCGSPVRWVDAVDCAAWAWWLCAVDVCVSDWRPRGGRWQVIQRCSIACPAGWWLCCVCAWLVVHSLSLVLVTRINCSWFEVESHCRFLVFGSWMVCAVAGREFLVRYVRCGGRHTTGGKGKWAAVYCRAAVRVLLRRIVSNMMLGVTVDLSLSRLS